MAVLTAIGAALATVSTVLGSTAFSIGAMSITWGMIAQAIIYGGMALSATLATRKPDFTLQSPTYQGKLQTQTDQNLPVPLLYGTVKLAGNRIWQDENGITIMSLKEFLLNKDSLEV